MFSVLFSVTFQYLCIKWLGYTVSERRTIVTNYLMTCRSMTYAQKSAHILKRAGIHTVVERAPTVLFSEGCSFAVRVSYRDLVPAMTALTQAGIPPLKVFLVNENGIVSRVFL